MLSVRSSYVLIYIYIYVYISDSSWIVSCLGGLLFPVFLSSWSCGMAGIPQVDMYGLGTVNDSFSLEGSSVLWVSYLWIYVVSDVTECVDSIISGSYIELGINTHMSVELLLLEWGCRILVFFLVTTVYLCSVRCVVWRKYSVSHWCPCSVLVDRFSY